MTTLAMLLPPLERLFDRIDAANAGEVAVLLWLENGFLVPRYGLFGHH